MELAIYFPSLFSLYRSNFRVAFQQRGCSGVKKPSRVFNEAMTKKSEIPTLFRCDNTHTHTFDKHLYRAEAPKLVRCSNPPLTSASRCGNVCLLPPDPSRGVYDAAGPRRTTARERGGRPHKRYGSLPRGLTIAVYNDKMPMGGRIDKP